MQFKGSKEYVSTDDLSIAVNAAINLEKPLLVKGEPGTGKTELARQISKSLNLLSPVLNLIASVLGIKNDPIKDPESVVVKLLDPLG